MDLLEFMMELDIYCYLVLKNMMPFTIGLNILQFKKVVLHMSFLITMQESLPLEKTGTFHNAIILINSVFNEDKNNYYYNIFLEKCSYK